MKIVRIFTKVFIFFVILFLFLGWIILFILRTKWLKICYKDYNYLVNIWNKVKICEEYRININQKSYDTDNKLREELNYINWTDDWYERFYYESWDIEEYNFKNKKVNWKYFYYYENWRIKTEWNINDTEKTWIWVWYLENWKVEKIFNYDKWELIYDKWNLGDFE